MKTNSPALQSINLFLLALLLFPASFCSAQEAPLLDWAVKTGTSISLYNPGDLIDTDASGNVYITGNFSGTQDFDPGPGTFNMSVTGSDDGLFISKLDSNGDFVWAKSIKNVYNTADAIAVDASGNVVIAGFFDKGDVMDFDPGPGTANVSAVGYDMFVLKLTTNGDFIWVKHIKGATTAAHVFPEGMALDAAGNIYTTGYFQTTIDFDPGAATFNITAGEFRDIFISKLDADGNFVWAKAMLGAGTCGACDDKGRSIALDASGNVYTSGFLRATADFDPGAGVFNLTPPTGGSFYVSKLDNNGDFIWAKTFGGVASGVADLGDMALDASGNVYITGGVYGTSDFDPGSGTFNLTAAGSSDVFICKLNGNGDFAWAKLFGAGSGDAATTLDTDGAGNIYTAGVFSGTVDFDPGPGTFNLAGGNDYFLQKLDTDGNFVWAYNMNLGYSTSIKIQSPNIYVLGELVNATSDFDPGPCVFNLTNTGSAMFIKKLRLGTAVSAPTISSFTPAIGPIGTSVTITGTNFSTTAAENVVKFFNNRTATVTASTATSITAIVPASTVTGVITVTTNCLTATSATNFTVGAPVLPTITSFTPISGSVGTPITITGTNFSTTPANNIVAFNGTAAIVTASSATSITTTVPAGATTGKISVTVSGNTATSATDFTVTTVALPTITSFTPASGPVGTTVTITGTNFSTTPASNTVAFNGTTAVATASTATSITTTVPSGATTGKISVTVSGNTATSATNFTVTAVALPTITSFTPASGPVATTVTITGTNFSTTAANNTVAFNGTTAVSTASTATSITTTVPSGATTGKISVTVSGNTATSASDFVVTTSGGAVTINTETLGTSIGGTITKDLVPLITTLNNNLDVNSIAIISDPPSGAVASISNGILTVDYTNIAFSGRESITIRACDADGNCTTQPFEIEIAGDILVYNALSPDGKNPVFRLEYIDLFPDTQQNTVHIYNRWGDEVFASKDYDNVTSVFRGLSSDGNKLPSGTYFYKVVFASGRKTMTGYLELRY